MDIRIGEQSTIFIIHLEIRFCRLLVNYGVQYAYNLILFRYTEMRTLINHPIHINKNPERLIPLGIFWGPNFI